MRRVAAFIFSLIMALSLVNTPGVYAKQDTPKVYEADTEAQSKADALIELGIISGYSPQGDVSKTMLDEAVSKITGSKIESTKFFNSNYKDSGMTVIQAVAIMLDIAGYTDYINASQGGYSATAVYKTARNTGVLKGVSTEYNKALKMEDFIKILYNTMFETDVMEQEQWGDNTNYSIKKDKTVGYVYKNILTVEGIVLASGKLNLTSMGELESDGLIIGNTQYTYKRIADPDTVIGRYARAFVTEKDNRRVLALEIVDSKNNTVNFESKDVETSGTTANRIVYYDSKEKKQTANLASTVNVVYNGELVPYYTKDDLTVDDAQYTLVDSDDDKVYDTVIISKYTPILVYRASDGKVSYTVVDYNNKTYNFDDFFEDGYSYIEENGTEAIWRDLSQYDILSLRQTKSGSYNKIIHNVKKVNGVYKTSRDDLDYITIDDTEYRVTSEFKNNSIMREKVSPGDEVTAFLDCFGRIVGAIPYKNNAEYVAVMAIGSAKAFGQYPIKYLSSSGKVETAVIDSTFKLNGKTVSAESVMNSSSNMFFNSDGSTKEQLVQLTVNSSGIVKAIDTADETKAGTGSYGYDGLTLGEDYSKSGITIATVNGTRVGNTKYFFDSDTVLYTVIRDDEELCEVRAQGPEDKAKVKLYNIDSDNHVGFAVEYTDKVTKNSKWLSPDATAYIVESTGVIKNPYEEGENAYAVYAYATIGGYTELRTLICDDPNYLMNQNKSNCLAWRYTNKDASKLGELDKAFKKEIEEKWMTTKWSEIPVGSVINVSESNGMVVNYVIQYLGGSDFPFEVIENNVETGSNMVGSWGYGVNETTWNGPALYSLGKVQQVNRFGIVVNNHLPTDPEGGEAAFPIKKYNRAVPLSTNMNVYFIDVNNSRNPIVRGTIMDINEGDKIFMRHRTGNADVIIVYR